MNGPVHPAATQHYLIRGIDYRINSKSFNASNGNPDVTFHANSSWLTRNSP